MVKSPSWRSKRRSVQWHCPQAPTLEPSNKERAPTQELVLSKRNFSPWPGWLRRFFFWVLFSRSQSRLVLVCFLFLLLFRSMAAGVTFQLPEGGTSGQTQGHEPKNRYWAPTQGRALSGTPLDVRCSWTLVPCIRSHESAGHLVVCVVTGQMVGDRWFPGATILVREFVYLLRQPLLSCPADRFRTS